jgi:hypothetical protein
MFKSRATELWCVLACTRRVSLSISVEMIGDGDLGEVVIEAKGRDVALFQASMGRIANLTLRQGGGKGIWFGVDIAQGRLHLEGCDITSQGIACVGICCGADPRLLSNRIHHERCWRLCGRQRPEGRWRTTTSSATLFRPWKSRRSEERGGGSADSSSRRWNDFRSGCDDAA